MDKQALRAEFDQLQRNIGNAARIVVKDYVQVAGAVSRDACLAKMQYDVMCEYRAILSKRLDLLQIPK